MAPGTEGLSTGTKNPLGIPVAFLISIGSLKVNKLYETSNLLKVFKYLTETVVLLGQFFIQ